MPRGEPTRTIRLPVWLLDQLAAQAGSADEVPALITRRLGARVEPRQSLGQRPRCTCANPVLSKYATSICTGCGRARG